MTKKLLQFRTEQDQYEFAYLDEENKLHQLDIQIYCATCKVWYSGDDKECGFCKHTNQSRRTS